MSIATMRGRAFAFIRGSAAAAALTVGLLTGGCGERGQLDTFAGSAGAAVAPEQTAAYAGMSKRALPRGTTFAPLMLGLQPGGTTGEIRFNWYSGPGDSASGTFVRLFEGDALVANETGTSGATSAENYRYHKAAVTGLKPNTEYTYWVSNNGVDWSEEYTYRTPSSGAFRFAAVSDVQYDKGDNIGLWQTVAAKIADAGASLIVNAGDHVQYCSESRGGGEAFYEKFFSPKELRSIPTAPVMGNHDMCRNFDEHFNRPNVDSIVEEYSSIWGSWYNFSNYYFHYNKVLFVGLNTAPYPESAVEAGKYIDAYRAIIKKAKSAHANQYDFLVVTHHKSTASISSTGHIVDSDIRYYVAAGFQKLMTEEEVDLVLAGHDHLYVKSKFMVDDKPSENGTLYLTLKPGGQTISYNTASTVGFDITTTKFKDYVDAYPFLQQKGRIGSTNIQYYLPLSYNNHSLYDPAYPGYAIIDVAYGRMTINVYDEQYGFIETFDLVKKR